MKNDLYRGKGLLRPDSLLLITIKKEKSNHALPLLPVGCEAFEADHLNISAPNKPCCTLVPIAKPATALLPAIFQYK